MNNAHELHGKMACAVQVLSDSQGQAGIGKVIKVFHLFGGLHTLLLYCREVPVLMTTGKARSLMGKFPQFTSSLNIFILENNKIIFSHLAKDIFLKFALQYF